MLLRDKITLLREGQKLSKNQLGKAIGATGSHVSMIESGRRTKFYLDTVCRLAKALDTSLDELIKDTEFDLSK